MAKLNINPGQGYTPIISASQYDVGRELEFVIYDGTTQASIPSGTIATMVGTKPSGLGFTQLGTVSGNTVTVITTATMTEEGGHIPAELRLTYSGNNIGTANFIFGVEASPHPEDVTDGDAETARDLMTRAEDAVTEAESAAQSAAASAARAEAAAAGAGLDATGAGANQVPTADGNGNWSWQDQQGGGGASSSDDVSNESDVSGSTVTDALNALSGEIATKQDALTFDNSPTSGSSNPVKSGGVYTALQAKQNALTFDNAPTSGSSNPVKSSGIYTALQSKAGTSTATTSANGLMSSTDKGRLDALYADYSSALTALGV